MSLWTCIVKNSEHLSYKTPKDQKRDQKVKEILTYQSRKKYESLIFNKSFATKIFIKLMVDYGDKYLYNRGYRSGYEEQEIPEEIDEDAYYNNYHYSKNNYKYETEMLCDEPGYMKMHLYIHSDIFSIGGNINLEWKLE